MKHYPKILGSNDKPPWGEECVAFYKLDGSNLRAEWSPKQGWYKYGTRTRTFDQSDPEYGIAIELFKNKYGGGIEKVLRDKYRKAEYAIVFFEFFGPHSFSGQHSPESLKELGVLPEGATHNDPKDLVLFDVSVHKRGFLSPEDFIKQFSHLHIPEVIYRGRYTEQFVEDVRQGRYPVEEGVVCKGGEGHALWQRKIKTFAYKNKVQKAFGTGWKQFWE